MTPPVKELRLRTIKRWMKDEPSYKNWKETDEELIKMAEDLDAEMMQAFSDREEALEEQMRQDKTLFTEEGLGRFQIDRLTLWREVLESFLAPTSDQELED